MEFEDQRRMYSLHMTEHPQSLGITQGSLSQHLHVQGAQPTEHPPRLLVGNIIEGALVVSPHVASSVDHSDQHHQMHHLLHSHQPGHSHPTPEQHTIINPSVVHLHQASLNSAHAQPQEHQATQLQHSQSIIRVVNDETVIEERTEIISGKSLEISSSVPADEAGLNNECDAEVWCLICNGTLGKSVESVDIFATLMTRSRRRLSALLSKIFNSKGLKWLSNHLCMSCFSNVDQVDCLEMALADSKMNLVRQYKNTFECRDSKNDDLHKKKVPPDDPPEWEDSGGDSIIEDDNDENDPDVTPATLKKELCRTRKSKRQANTKRVSKPSVKSKFLSFMDDSKEKDVRAFGKRKRGRGRPRKEDLLVEEQIPPGVPSKSCPNCNKVVLAKKYLSHLFLHRLFPCSFCPEIFKRRDIKTHIAKCHQQEIHYPCTECDRSFDTFMKLRRHCLVVHVGLEVERTNCKICNKTFSSSNGLKVHLETIHSKPHESKCPGCEESFSQEGNMQNHFRRVHMGDKAKKLLCNLCRKGFICPSDLRKHVERVHLKIRRNEVVCEVCSKTFSDSRAMKIHMNSIHTKEVKYPCPDCKIVFHSLTNMVTHRRRMHSGNEGRKNICEICAKGFCSPSDLRTHVKVVHENVRKYVCDICQQGFKVGSHLKYHRRRHTGETPYKCPHCGKSFHGPSHIADHVKKVHKTIYMGVNQRRRLNLPENTPAPPPGILSSREAKPRSEANEIIATDSVPQQQIESSATEMTIAHTNALPSTSVTSLAPMQHLPHNMMQFATQTNHMVQTSAMIDPYGMPQNPYPNMQYDQTTTHSPVPMVIRLLNEGQY